MPMTDNFYIDGEHEVTITTMVGKSRSADIVFSPEEIQEWDDSTLISILRTFAARAREVAVILIACECNYKGQFVPDENLHLVIRSDLSTDRVRAFARQELACRHNSQMRAELDHEVYEREAVIRKKRKKKLCEVVYLLLDPPGLYKIGRTADLNQRLRELKRLVPVPLSLVGAIVTDDAGQLERDLHEHFADKREQGEWFRLSDKDVEYFMACDDAVPD